MENTFNQLIKKYTEKKAISIDEVEFITDLFNINSSYSIVDIKSFARILKSMGCKFRNYKIFQEDDLLSIIIEHIEDINKDNKDNIDDEDEIPFEELLNHPTPSKNKSNRSFNITDYAKSYPLLNREEEVLLAKAIENGYIEAKDRFILSNIRLVISIALENNTKGLELDDLIQEGFIGLIKAVEKFDYTMGTRFSTYATVWIKQKINRAIADKDKIIRLPVYVVENINTIKSEVNRYHKKFHREPTIQEIASIMDISEDQIKDLLEIIERYDRHLPSIDAPVGDGQDTFLKEFIEDKNTSIEKEALKGLGRCEIKSVFSTLTVREARILEFRYGFIDARERTLAEIGKEFGVTRERIRQIEEKALRKLRHPSRSNRLKDFLEEI
ncbi:MAG: sigma-70 family RNA polymerase sigma factor [bacterium]